MADTERRLCFDGSNRQPKFVIPSIRDNLAKGAVPKGLILECALWCRYCYGVDEKGAVIEANDPDWETLVATARQAKSKPSAWLEMRTIYGDLVMIPNLRQSFDETLNYLWSRGVDAAIGRYLAND